jgi:hypothetical protein
VFWRLLGLWLRDVARLIRGPPRHCPQEHNHRCVVCERLDCRIRGRSWHNWLALSKI